MKIRCTQCNKVMPKARAELFPTCKGCTNQTKKIGFMDYEGRSEAPSLVFVDTSDQNLVDLTMKYFRVK